MRSKRKGIKRRAVKKIKKSIKSLKKQEEIHGRKIKNYDYGSEKLIEYWRREIEEFERKRKIQEDKLDQ